MQIGVVVNFLSPLKYPGQEIKLVIVVFFKPYKVFNNRNLCPLSSSFPNMKPCGNLPLSVKLQDLEKDLCSPFDHSAAILIFMFDLSPLGR